MITNVIGYQEQKCWKAGSNLSAAKFDRVNIIFGHNGAGKSSLASIVAKAHLANGDATTARFFGGKYVDSTLLLEDKSGIRGIVSNFGEKDVTIEKKIDANSQKIDELIDDIATQAAVVRQSNDQAEKLIKEIVKRRKDSNTKIHNKPENKTVKEKTDLWIKDYDEAFKQFPDEDYNAITGNADFSAESEKLNLIPIASMPNVDEELVDGLVDILATEYKNVEIPDHEIVKWLQDGTHIHEGKDHCEFCGTKIDIEKIKKRVDAFLNDEKHKATVILKDYKRQLEELGVLAQELIDHKDVYQQTFDLTDDQVDFDTISESAIRLAKIIIEVIDQKLNRMEIRVNFIGDNLTDSINNISNSVKILEDAKKQSSQSLLDKINLLETLVKGSIGLEIKNTTSMSEDVAKVDTATKKIKTLEMQQEALRVDNERLRSQKSDLADFATYLNEVLKDLNLNFNLFPSGKVYVLRHADGSALKLDDISDGERNLLSLIYFYYEMMSDTYGNLKDTIQLIVIDDPISSLDDNNKFYITDLVKSMLNQINVQIFTMSHSWDDFCNLAYGRNHEGVTLYEIKKESGLGNIYPISNNKLLRPYIMLYREINEFRKKRVSDISDEVALHMPNTMRRVLEEYVKFRVDVDFATAGHDADIAKALFGEELSSLSNTKKQKLNQLLDVCNILSHKAKHPKNPSEIHESAKFLIGSIEQYDKYHHLKMIGN